MSVTCQCGRPVDGSTLCTACQADLRRLLEDVPALVAELEVTLTRQARLGDRNGPRSADKPLPYDPRASEAGWVLRNTLVGWVRILVDESGLDMPKTGAVRHGDGLTGVSVGGRTPTGDVSTAEIATWLLAQVHHLAQHVAGDEALEEIGSAVDQVRRAIDRRPRDRTYLGPHTCGTDLTAAVGVTTVTCPGCGTDVHIDDQQARIRTQLHDHLGTATYVAMVATGLGVPVTAEAVTMWRNRHYLHAIDSRSGRLYRVGDVIDVAQADRTERKQRARTLTQTCAH